MYARAIYLFLNLKFFREEIFMSRSNKRRFAVTLLGALAFGASDASAMDSSIKKRALPKYIEKLVKESK